MTEITIDWPEDIIEDMDKFRPPYYCTREEWIVRAVVLQHFAFKQWAYIDEKDKEILR